MSACQLINQLENQGVMLSITSEAKLKFDSISPIDHDTLQAIKDNRDDLIHHLSVDNTKVVPIGTKNEPPTDDSDREPVTDALAHLLIRYEAGHFSEPVRARLAEIFQGNPPNAMERLHKACDYLKAHQAHANYQKLKHLAIIGKWNIPSLALLLEYFDLADQGDGEAIVDIYDYLTNPSVASAIEQEGTD